MKISVWKFELPDVVNSRVSIKMPKVFNIVHFAYQDGIPCIWAEIDVNTVGQYIAVDFILIGTGHPVPDERVAYLDTGFVGPYVFHLYEYEKHV